MAAQPRAIVDVALTPVSETAPTSVVLMFERLATNKDVDVAKLERLIAMQEHILALEAKAAFNRAFAAMQGEIPAILEGSRTDKGSYASLEAIQAIVRPILERHGFGLSFRTEWPAAGVVKVIGLLTHRDGHERSSEFMSSADTSGAKNAIQALGSAVSYGRRYTTKDLLNITTRGADDDGRGGRSAAPIPTPPPAAPAPVSAYLAWLDRLRATAHDGTAALERVWYSSPNAFRKQLTTTNLAEWDSLKVIAARLQGRPA